jgi:hypothetical protein
MRTYKKIAVNKLVARFDNELRNILMNDLKTMKCVKNQIANTIKHGLNQDNLSVA